MNSLEDPDPFGRRVLTFGSRAVDLDGNVLLAESDTQVTYRTAAGGASGGGVR